MFVKCLSQAQKLRFGVSERTIHRVIVEYGVATPVERIKGDAYLVMQTLKKHNIKPDQLEAYFNKPLLTAANVRWFLLNCPKPLLETLLASAERRKSKEAADATV